MAALALVALIGAGCGAGKPSGTESTAGTPTARKAGAKGQDKGVRFAECMRGNGVPDFPDPDAKGEFAYGVSVAPAVFTRAVKACKDLEPPGALSSKRNAKQQSKALRFAACIRAHGVKDFPDPVDGEPLVDTTKIPSSDAPGGMTILNAAMRKCGAVLGLEGGGQG